MADAPLISPKLLAIIGAVVMLLGMLGGMIGTFEMGRAQGADAGRVACLEGMR